MLLERPDTFRLNPFHPLADGLVFAGLGNLAGTTHYHDSSLYGNHGELTNMDPPSDWVSALGRRAVDLDGSNDVVYASVDLAPPFSLTCWVWHNAGYVRSLFLGAANSAATTPYYAIGEANLDSKDLVYRFYPNGETVAFNDGVVADTWQHFALVVASTTSAHAWLNGQQSATEETYNTSSFVVNRISLGVTADSTPALPLAGSGCDWMAWNRALSLPEIQQLADPSNMMLSGLILPPRRKWWPVVSSGFKPAWARNCNHLIGGGVG